MTIERRSFISEILYRLDENGLVAAHVIDSEGVYEDGVLIPGTLREGLPRAVTAAEVGDIIGKVKAKLTETADRRAAELNAMREERDQALAEATAAQAARQDQALQHEEVSTAIVEMGDAMAKKVEENDALSKRLIAVTRQASRAGAEARRLKAVIKEMEKASVPAEALAEGAPA